MNEPEKVTFTQVLKALVAERPVAIDARASRPVKVINVDGEVVRETSSVEVMATLLKREELESEVLPSKKRRKKKREFKNCAECSLPFIVNSRTQSAKVKWCTSCRYFQCSVCKTVSSVKRSQRKITSPYRCKPCIKNSTLASMTCACGSRITDFRYYNEIKHGRTPTCRPCWDAKPKEPRPPSAWELRRRESERRARDPALRAAKAERMRALSKSRSKEDRQRAIKKAFDSKSPEEAEAWKKAFHAASKKAEVVARRSATRRGRKNKKGSGAQHGKEA